MLSRRILLTVLTVVLSLPFVSVYAQDTSLSADLEVIKSYLIEKATALHAATTNQAEAAGIYYGLAEATDFDYAALWDTEEAAVQEALLATRAAWIEASPLYEQIEGVVAGVPSLSEYDVNLDAGASGDEDPEGGVTFDLTLPDGTVLERPGNLFGILEAALWGTIPEYTSGVSGDLDANGSIDFGEVLPDANLVRASAEMMSSMTASLLVDAEAWEPTTSDVFTALVVMVPTMSEYFGSWKESRFVSGEDATGTNFVVISRLADIQDILSGLEVIYAGVGPLVESADEAQHTQIGTELTDLREYVADLYAQEQDGRQFTPEEADFFGSEAQDRAMQIAGQITQVAALLDIELAE